MFFLIFLLFQFFVVSINPIRQERALNVGPCKDKSANLWMVSIQRDGKHKCNGVILDESAILTTALCCIEKLNCSKTGPNSHIQVIHPHGLLPKFQYGETCGECSITTVSYCIIHPNYVKKEYNLENDAAIVVLTDKLSTFEEAPFSVEIQPTKEFHKICNKGMVMGWWYHYKQDKLNSELECFPATVKSLWSCDDVASFVYVRKRSNNLTITCSFDASNRYEVCEGFYGAALMCGGKLVGLVSHKFNFSEQCEQVSPFYYARMDWTLCFRLQWYLDKKEDEAKSLSFRQHCSKEFESRSMIDRSHQNSSGYFVRAELMKQLYIFLLLNHIIRT